MTANSLEAWSVAVRSSWDSPDQTLVEDCHRYLKRLALTPETEPWLADLRRNRPANRELYRDSEHGFVLLAHSEPEGLYRPPHDHGRSWVIYAVQEGEVEMGAYAATAGDGNGCRLVKCSSTRMRAGDVQLYRPGDIHDTLCVEGPALLFRFTERDLRLEKLQGRMTRYARQGGVWMAEAA